MKDLTDFKGKFRKSPPKADSDTYISYMKVLAVYGKVDTKENLAQITDVTKNLGETQTISCDDVSPNYGSFQYGCEKLLKTYKKFIKKA